MASNELRGRVAIEAGGKKYTFHFGFEAIRQLEKLFDVKGWKNLGDRFDNFGDWSLEEQLQVVRIGLEKFHGKDNLTDEQLEAIAFGSERGLLMAAIEALTAGGRQIVGESELQRRLREAAEKAQPDPRKKASAGGTS
jgi:hypothetical protein